MHTHSPKARLSGHEDEDPDYVELEAVLHSQRKVPHYTSLIPRLKDTGNEALPPSSVTHLHNDLDVVSP